MASQWIMNSELRTQTIVYSTLKLQNDFKVDILVNHKTFRVREISVKTSKVVTGTDATLLWCLVHK